MSSVKWIKANRMAVDYSSARSGTLDLVKTDGSPFLKVDKEVKISKDSLDVDDDMNSPVGFYLPQQVISFDKAKFYLVKDRGLFFKLHCLYIILVP
jgi:hypothetical protein